MYCLSSVPVLQVFPEPLQDAQVPAQAWAATTAATLSALQRNPSLATHGLGGTGALGAGGGTPAAGNGPAGYGVHPTGNSVHAMGLGHLMGDTIPEGEDADDEASTEEEEEEEE